MSTVTTNPIPAPVVPAVPAQAAARSPAAAEPLGMQDLYRLTVDEYERIGGMLDDGRVELINGYLVRKMSKKPPHISTVKGLYHFLSRILPAGWTWQKEDPVRIPEFDEPEPDISVLKGSDSDYRNRIPEPDDVALIVEVSETTLGRDQGPKLLAYARSRIPIYWIVNLAERRVEVYSDPSPEGYRTRRDYHPGESVPVVTDGTEVGRITVADLLP